MCRTRKPRPLGYNPSSLCTQLLSAFASLIMREADGSRSSVDGGWSSVDGGVWDASADRRSGGEAASAQPRGLPPFAPLQTAQPQQRAQSQAHLRALPRFLAVSDTRAPPGHVAADETAAAAAAIAAALNAGHTSANAQPQQQQVLMLAEHQQQQQPQQQQLHQQQQGLPQIQQQQQSATRNIAAGAAATDSELLENQLGPPLPGGVHSTSAADELASTPVDTATAMPDNTQPLPGNVRPASTAAALACLPADASTTGSAFAAASTAMHLDAVVVGGSGASGGSAGSAEAVEARVMDALTEDLLAEVGGNAKASLSTLHRCHHSSAAPHQTLGVSTIAATTTTTTTTTLSSATVTTTTTYITVGAHTCYRIFSDHDPFVPHTCTNASHTVAAAAVA